MSGSQSYLLLLMAFMVIVMIILPASRARKAKRELEARQSLMLPGTRVMTNFGLYGTIVSLDKEENLAQLEIAPGTVVSVHALTVTTLLDEKQEQAPAEAGDQEPSQKDA